MFKENKKVSFYNILTIINLILLIGIAFIVFVEMRSNADERLRTLHIDPSQDSRIVELEHKVEILQNKSKTE